MFSKNNDYLDRTDYNLKYNLPNWNSPFGNNTLAVLFHVDKNFERTS